MLPPPDAQLQSDGSFVQVGTDGYMLRWTQRPDKSWRRPERSRIAQPSISGYRPAGKETSHSSRDPGTKMLTASQRLSNDTSIESGVKAYDRRDEAEPGETSFDERCRQLLAPSSLPSWLTVSSTDAPKSIATEAIKTDWEDIKAPVAAEVDWGNEPQDQSPARSPPPSRVISAPVAAHPSASSTRSNLPKEPSRDAVLQVDGSFIARQEDGSIVRWTRRPDGSWRKPEHHRVGYSNIQVGKEPMEDSGQSQHIANGDTISSAIKSGCEELPYHNAVKESVFEQMVRNSYPCADISPQTWTDSEGTHVSNGSRPQALRLLHRDVDERCIDVAHEEQRERPVVLYSGADIPREPPAESIALADGSFVLNQDDGSSVTWSRRPDGSWRKPVHHRSGWSSRKNTEVVEDQRPTNKDFCQEGEKRLGHGQFEAAQYFPKVPPPRYEPPEIPPDEAEEQPDGTFVLELEDGSSVRWTKRPNGTWRKPEHKKAGWVGDLEREKYTIPAVRNGENLMMDPDYLREPRRGPDRDENRLSAVLAMMQVSGWQ